MSDIIPEDKALFELPFGRLPADRKVKIFGVTYASLRLSEGGEIFITLYGWSRLPNILPNHWHRNKKFARVGERLAGSTGMVYRVPTVSEGKEVDLVVKFSRFAQDVPLGVEGTFPDDLPRQVMDEADWNDPFEEFGIVMDLRRGRFGPPNLKIRTKRPLCIYCPNRDYLAWQLGRKDSIMDHHSRVLERDQLIEHGGVELHRNRMYVLVYEWVKGLDAEQCESAGLITAEEMKDVAYQTAWDMAAKGFLVLDHKPRHVILRPQGDGTVLKSRQGDFIYTLVDFELLQRTPEYIAWLKDLYTYHI